jgi:hypothetical protein
MQRRSSLLCGVRIRCSSLSLLSCFSRCYLVSFTIPLSRHHSLEFVLTSRRLRRRPHLHVLRILRLRLRALELHAEPNLGSPCRARRKLLPRLLLLLPRRQAPQCAAPRRRDSQPRDAALVASVPRPAASYRPAWIGVRRQGAALGGCGRFYGPDWYGELQYLFRDY